MKTDQAIYQYLATGSEAVRVLTGGLILHGVYKFSAPVLKSVERRIDALFVPQDHDGPVYIIEFQAQSNSASWYNLLAKIGLYGEKHPQKQIYGILIFPHRGLDTDNSNWLRQSVPNIISVAYMDEFLPKFFAQEPENPFVAALAPLILSDDQELQQLAPNLWRTIQSAPKPICDMLEQILEFWFFERFKTYTDEEVLAMFQALVPLEETRAYQCIMAKGEAKGEARGEARGKAEGKAEGEAKGKAEEAGILLGRLIIRRFGQLPKWAQARIDKADVAQLEAWAEGIFDAKDVKELLGG